MQLLDPPICQPFSRRRMALANTIATRSIVESEKSKAKAAAERAAKEERYRTRLKNLTWGKLLAETPFERWVPSPPFPPAEFTEAAREAIHNACRELRELGPKPPKAKVVYPSFDVVLNGSTKRTKLPGK